MHVISESVGIKKKSMRRKTEKKENSVGRPGLSRVTAPGFLACLIGRGENGDIFMILQTKRGGSKASGQIWRSLWIVAGR